MLVAFLIVGPFVHAAQPAVPPAEEPKPPPSVLDQLKNPNSILHFGGDLRLRHTYLKNEFDFDNDGRDNRSFFRIRGRLWGKVGPFLQQDIEQPNGLTFYTRLTYEPRYVVQWNGDYDQPLWDELIVDNLYVDWKRPGGLPFSLKVGRQDLFFGDLRKGRGLVLVDPSILEGSRTLYSDAIRATIHLDAIKGSLDLIAMNNLADQDRLTPLGNKDRFVSEYNQSVYVAYFRSRMVEGHEFGAYYIHKNEDLDRDYVNQGLNDRMVHTVGIPLMGKCGKNIDYYAEFAYQWGTEGRMRRQSYAITTDLGYTVTDSPWTPRFHGGYEYLTGDDPSTRDWEGWDPVMSRWPQWSELLGYRWAVETGGMPFYYTNLHRFTLGFSVQPIKRMTFLLDHSILLTDTHPNGKAGRYRSGHTRGQLTVAKVAYGITKNTSMHVWLERFHPGSYYSDAQDSSALFFRTQFVYKF